MSLELRVILDHEPTYRNSGLEIFGGFIFFYIDLNTYIEDKAMETTTENRKRERDEIPDKEVEEGEEKISLKNE